MAGMAYRGGNISSVGAKAWRHQTNKHGSSERTWRRSNQAAGA